MSAALHEVQQVLYYGSGYRVLCDCGGGARVLCHGSSSYSTVLCHRRTAPCYCCHGDSTLMLLL